MSKPGIIPIGDARRIAEERGVPMVVIFAVHADREQFTVTTYGQTKKFCRLAGDWGKQIADGIMGSTIAASQVEPLDVPEDPTIWTKSGRAAESSTQGGAP